MLPAYAGLLSSMGLAFLMQTAYLLPFTVAMFVLALGALRFRAQKRWGSGPFYVGALAAFLVVVGKFALESSLMTSGGIGLLVTTSIWNSWPRKTKASTGQSGGSERDRTESIQEETRTMPTKRIVEIFGAGCPVCQESIDMIKRIACSSCDVKVLNMHESSVAERAKSLGVRSVPAVAIDGKLVDCCAGRGPDEATLRAAGLGQQLS